MMKLSYKKNRSTVLKKVVLNVFASEKSHGNAKLANNCIVLQNSLDSRGELHDELIFLQDKGGQLNMMVNDGASSMLIFWVYYTQSK